MLSGARYVPANQENLQIIDQQEDFNYYEKPLDTLDDFNS